MEERFEEILRRCAEIEDLLTKPEVLADRERSLKLSREHAELRPLCKKCEHYKTVLEEIEEIEGVSRTSEDVELLELARSELSDLSAQRDRLKEDLLASLIPKDSEDEKNVIVEIRAGTGGNEASLFASDLFRMYSKYVEKKGWQTDLISSHPTEIGGFKEIVFSVNGQRVYRNLKFESGVHRVQRVPVTESGGRIHTSTVTVAVLPEAEEVDLEIDAKDLKVETFRASGHGGQHVNKSSTAVRITHVPTGITAASQSERSQHQNRMSAMKVLRARLLNSLRSQEEGKMKARRRTLVGTGERSEKIRTYNFPQSRVTDHRVDLTLHRLEEVLNGDLEEIVEALLSAYEAELMKES